jgi:hypothetical protein
MKRWCWIALVLGLCVALPAAAAEWVLVAGNDTVQVFVDKSSIALRGQYFQAWSMEDYLSPQTTRDGGKPYLSTKVLAHYDCQSRRRMMLHLVDYAQSQGAGSVVESFTASLEQTSGQMHDVDPDTFGEAQLNYVCKNAPKPKAAPPKSKE